MSDRPAEVLIYVQHLLGTGHLHRAAAVARAAGRAGLEVVLASGGPPVPGIEACPARLVQLPPLRARDESFAELVDAAGRTADAAAQAARRDRLLALFHRLRPKVLVTEMFPFGRRRMRFELEPLLGAAHAAERRPRIVCSLRDVLTTPGDPAKVDWMLRTFARFYDAVLVHGDPEILPLERSFPRAGELAGRIRYTGYVLGEMPPAAAPAGVGAGEVIVSTGGGAVAGPLIEAAFGARPLGPLAEAPWRILVGPNLDEARFRAIARTAPAGVLVERARADFRHLLARGRLSISQAGYNTLIEVLAAGIPAVVVPFASARETEQALRARALAARGDVILVEPAELDAPGLAAAMRRALEAVPGAPGPAHGARGGPRLNLDGARETARILREMIAIVGA